MALDLCLVNMPHCAVERPSLALGLISSIVKNRGRSVRQVHANLDYIDLVGIADYRLIARVPIEFGLGDWLFAGIAFPEHPARAAEYAAWLVDAYPGFKRHYSVESLAARMEMLRGRSADFVEWMAQRVLALRPRIVGCTSTFQQHVASLALLRRLKALDPALVTIMGGANCESDMGLSTHRLFPWVDVVVSGEADDLVGPLVDRLLECGADLRPADPTAGVFVPAHRAGGYPGSGRVAPRAVVDDLGTIPPPDYDDYFDELGRCLNQQAIVVGIPFETSRGCWWGEKSHCTFCGLNGGSMRFRSKPPAQALAEIDALIARYGIKRLEPVDNILDLDYFDTVLPELARRHDGLTLFYETKSNLKRVQVDALHQAGIRWLQPGIESFSTEVLTLMRKGVTGVQNVRLLRHCRERGIRVGWSMLWGFPHERDEWYAAMEAFVPWLEHLHPGPPVLVRYDRFSPFHQRPAAFGLVLEPYSSYAFVYPLGPEDLRQLAYFFEDHAAPPVAELQARRPATMRLIERMHEWIAAWSQRGADGPPALAWDADGMDIVDTRSRAIAPRWSPDPLCRRLLHALDDGLTAAALATRCADCAPDELAAALAELQRRGMVILIDGRYLSIVLAQTPLPLARLRDAPFGYLDGVTSVRAL